MLTNQTGGYQQTLTHVVYDKTNGRVLGRFRRYDVTDDEYCECEPDEVLAMFSGDERVLGRVADGNVHNLAVLTTTLPSAAKLDVMRVSAKRQVLVSLPRLRLRADRDVLEGDGEDSVTIYIDVVDEQGPVLRDYEGEIHVTTTRGKLSARGGRAAVKGGQGSLTLTSVHETVDQVWVRARAPDGSAVSDELLLSFE